MSKYFTNKQALQQLAKPDAIVFDWDNTLVDTWPVIHQAINGTMQAMQKPSLTLTEVRNSVHKSMRESFPDIFGNNWQEAGEIYKKLYRQTHIETIRLLPYALELIKFIHTNNIPQFLVSNKIGATLRLEVSKLNIDHYFFSIIGANDANADKPSREPLDLALLGSDLDTNKHNIWFIGDTIADVECAYNSNCTPIIFGHSDNQISNSISDSLITNGKNNQGPIPVYFYHQELITILQNYV
jgi:phosphoglycolate phosphatase